MTMLDCSSSPMNVKTVKDDEITNSNECHPITLTEHPHYFLCEKDHKLLPSTSIFTTTAPDILTSTKNNTMARIAPLPPATLTATTTTTTTTNNCSSTNKEEGHKSSSTYMLFLIRHGEASHNVLEKAAQQRAKEEALACGLSPEETYLKMEHARQQVLEDESLLDASLSPQGKEEAKLARQQLETILVQNHLPPPKQVLVSPLTRTLETANWIFPHDGQHEHHIHVREELRERFTGKPCDQRSCANTLRSRPSFKRFSMERLSSLSTLCHHQSGWGMNPQQHRNENENENDDDDSSSETSAIIMSPQTRRGVSEPIPPSVQQQLLLQQLSEEEDKAMLRVRTRKLLDLIAEPFVTDNDDNNNNHELRSIAVVTHKGYLRELERGPFGNPSAKEFSNAEIRVYKVELYNKDNSLKHVQRIV